MQYHVNQDKFCYEPIKVIQGGTQKNRIFFKQEDLFTFRTKNT